jgi:hypothetical protein
VDGRGFHNQKWQDCEMASIKELPVYCPCKNNINIDIIFLGSGTISEKKGITVSVLGDPEKVEALKAMGYGNLTYAFRVGCDVVLGAFTEDVARLEIKKKDLEEQLHRIEGELMFITSEIDRLQQKNAQQRLAEYGDKEQLEKAVSEYQRCAPLIIYKKMTQIAEHLAGLMDWTSTKEVRDFFAGRDVEPTEKEIRAFLEKQ